MPATAEDLYLEYRKNPVPTPWEEVEQTPAEEVVALRFPPGIEAPPAPLEHLTHVRALTLTGEPRKAVPSWVFDLPSLERLRLTGLGLKLLPARLAEIAPRLVHLDVWGNELTALPDWMEQFERLRSLHVKKNTWSRVSPEDWGALPALECFKPGEHAAHRPARSDRHHGHLGPLPDGPHGLEDQRAP